MAKKTYTYKTSSFTVGTLILMFLFLLSLAFLAGYYLGKRSPGISPPEETSEEVSSREIVPRPVTTGEKAMPEKTPRTVEEKESVKKEKVSPAVPEEKPVPAPAEVKKVPPVDEVKGDYFLQVAALRNGASARKLSRALERAGYPGRIEHRRGFYRVLVGPFTLQKARTLREKLPALLRKMGVRVRSPRDILIRRLP